MKTCNQILAELKQEEKPASKAVLARHGAQEPFYGISLQWLKKYAKALKREARAEKPPADVHGLGHELWASGISDARYLAGLLFDPQGLSSDELNNMVLAADWSLHSEYTVPGLAAESGRGWELGLQWIEAGGELVASAGWACLASVLALEQVPQPTSSELQVLLDRVRVDLPTAPNRVRYCMNNFVIAVGVWSETMTAPAKACAQALGTVKVNMGDSACKVPGAIPYIEKIEAMGRIGHKRKRVLCE